MNAVLSVRDLNVGFSASAHAVRGVSFDVYPGETLCIVGESGSGKSMTSLAVMGLLPPAARLSASSILLEGKELVGLSPNELNQLRGSRMAMIFQEPMTSLNPSMRIGEQMIEGLRHHGKASHEQAWKRAVELLAWTGIGDTQARMSMYPHQLSGGLRQRVMIAMSLMCSPSLLIADEPTTALDVTTQLKILGLLSNVQKKFGTAILLITHDLGVVAKVADRVAVMYGGKIVEAGPAQDVLKAPRHPYTRALLDCLPQAHQGELLKVIPGSIPVFKETSLGCGFASRCVHAGTRCDDDALLEAKFAAGARCVRPISYAPTQAARTGGIHA